MTWALVGISVAALSVAAAAVGASIYFGKRALDRAAELVRAVEQIGELHRANDAFGRTNDHLTQQVAMSERRYHAEVEARKLAEEQRDDAVKRLAETGDVEAVADRMRSSVDRLRKLAEEVPKDS